MSMSCEGLARSPEFFAVSKEELRDVGCSWDLWDCGVVDRWMDGRRDNGSEKGGRVNSTEEFIEEVL